MSEPTGKLKFAYDSIRILEAKNAKLQQRIDDLEEENKLLEKRVVTMQIELAHLHKELSEWE